MIIKYGGVNDLFYYPLTPLNSIVCLVPGVLAFIGAVFGKKRAFYRGQRISINVPNTETNIKIIEVCLGIVFFFFSHYFSF